MTTFNTIRKAVALATALTGVLAAPAFAERTIPHIVEIVKDGTATLSANKKTLVDEKGTVVAKEVDPATVKPPAPDPTKLALGIQEAQAITVCNYRCAILTKRCFADDTGAVVCINFCD